jgi:ADP-heptose:LPS heptosyltransferase
VEASQRFLVVRLSSLGDVVLIEPVVRALRAGFPRAKIDVLTDARYAELGRAILGADEVIGYDRRGEDRGWAGMSRVIGRLPARRYEAVIDLQNKVRTRLLCSRIEAEQKRVLQKRSFTRAAFAALGHDPPLSGRHQVDLYLSIVETLGITAPRDDRPRAVRPKPLYARASSDGSAWIGLCPGATHATKRWPIDRFLSLMRSLRAKIKSARFVLIGGAMDQEALAAIEREANDPDLIGADSAKLDVRGLLGAIASLDMLISVDTGPAHIAAAIGVPVVTIFGPTAPERWGPRGPEHRVVSLGLDCAPCSNTGGDRCPIASRSHECMQALGVDRVCEAVLSVLSARGDGER